MIAALYPYQHVGARFLAERRYAYLADQPGLGKTPQAITACDLVAAERVVVLCPAIARENWRREFQRWSTNTGRTLLIESYDRAALRMDVRAHIEALAPDVLILDEAHYLRNQHTKRTKSVLGLDGKSGLAATAARVWCLSGTPAPSNVLALWPILRAFWPHLLPESARTYTGFMSRYTHFLQTRYGVKVVGSRNTGELRLLLSHVMLRRHVAEVLPDLPKLVWSSVAVARESDDEADLDEALRAAGPELETLIEHEALGARAQLARVRRLVGEAKARPAVRLIGAELSDGAYDKVIVFAHHRNVIGTLAAGLSAFNPVVVTGDTSPAKRQEAIDAFQDDASVRVFIGQIEAASTAITLTAASQVVFVEASWTPDDNDQAARRALRIGQDRPVFARILALADSLDDGVARVLERKQRLLAEVFDSIPQDNPTKEEACSR